MIGWLEIMMAFGGDHSDDDEFRGNKIMYKQILPYRPSDFLPETIEKNLNKELVSGKDYEEVLYYREAAPYRPTYYLMTLIAEVFWSHSRSNRFLMPIVYAYVRALHGHPYNWAKAILKSLKYSDPDDLPEADLAIVPAAGSSAKVPTKNKPVKNKMITNETSDDNGQTPKKRLKPSTPGPKVKYSANPQKCPPRPWTLHRLSERWRTLLLCWEPTSEIFWTVGTHHWSPNLATVRAIGKPSSSRSRKRRPKVKRRPRRYRKR
ncbi:hypothetical protein R1sor_024200 [Riccia sorocarpa]|uniref:Uncharacterized protein n=1 Tax=Riccia sorocarpa TaxID=122646 RepID=A0ABD3GVT6_9MARC